MKDFLFRGKLADLDHDVHKLNTLEAERQFRKLILIPSESTASMAVREALSSAFQNVYAEGYPDEETRWMSEDEILDYPARLAHYRRHSDPRYYKGVEYINIVEALARRRCAETFATNGVSADDLYVNVQALSGGPANNAIYHALVNPGDTIMGMNLLHGGHLSHGSPVNRSGKYYNAIHYNVDADTEQIDYESLKELARQHRPKFIIAGYSSYPWAVDWAQFREIADEAGALLFADIAHVAGLVAGGVYPSPVGYADVISFTTHKSLCGPRGACILTTDAGLSRKIDRAVFPGEQGGPHVNVFAAMAVAFKLAQTDQFRKLQAQIVENCVSLTQRLEGRGFRIPYGGTNTHLTNLDCKSITGPDGTYLSGDQAARILDIGGIVVNRNTIPGDKSAANPSGIRLGTPWVTQRGFGESEIAHLADIIADLLQAVTPYSQPKRKGKLQQTKVDFDVLEKAKMRTRVLAQSAGIDYEPTHSGYPHSYFLDDYPQNERDWVTFEISGEKVKQFINFVVSSDVETLQPGDSQYTRLYLPGEQVDGSLKMNKQGSYILIVPSAKSGVTAAWLRDLSDGFVAFDDDLLRKIPGPVMVDESSDTPEMVKGGDPVGARKPYFIGIQSLNERMDALPEFTWQEKEAELRRTPIYETHKRLGGKMIPFAGWEMPVWYSSVVEEHQAVRQTAGLFDVAHMGVYQAEGPQAAVFLDCVVGNDISALGVGKSLYTHFLDPEGNVIDDLLIYRRDQDKYLLVVNASNDDKDWAWLNAVKDGEVQVDKVLPWVRAYGRDVLLRNLRDPKEGSDMLVDIAIQGPRSREILLALGADEEGRKRIMQLKWAQLCEVEVGGFDLVVSRTGYTGERMAFELFVHPDRADELFNALLDSGVDLGLKPCGLGARDSLRTEAGLPLYGHEMGGEMNLGVGEAGFGSYVKVYKPWFIGREAFLAVEKDRQREVLRFRFNEKGVRMAHLGDPVVDKRGRVIGQVTSCAVDREGFLTGQAFMDKKHSEEGASIYIFQSAPKSTGKAPAELVFGDRVILPTQAVVVSRFMK
jgi:glycine hydroxymethyltransferase